MFILCLIVINCYFVFNCYYDSFLPTHIFSLPQQLLPHPEPADKPHAQRSMVAPADMPRTKPTAPPDHASSIRKGMLLPDVARVRLITSYVSLPCHVVFDMSCPSSPTNQPLPMLHSTANSGMKSYMDFGYKEPPKQWWEGWQRSWLLGERKNRNEKRGNSRK